MNSSWHGRAHPLNKCLLLICSVFSKHSGNGNTKLGKTKSLASWRNPLPSHTKGGQNQYTQGHNTWSHVFPEGRESHGAQPSMKNYRQLRTERISLSQVWAPRLVSPEETYYNKNGHSRLNLYICAYMHRYMYTHRYTYIHTHKNELKHTHRT